MRTHEIRQKYLDFFQEKGHRVEPSASLVPVDDPTLLWINSGVATLKKYFDGRVTPDNPRIVNAQKSIRTNDIENVGYTKRHHTFFEMLGNFSIGDYFKEEAILWAWEFLTSPKWMGLSPDRLSVTIHLEDDEAEKIWHEQVGVPKERIVRLEENFWDIGEGPSGPNTEIFYDRGEEFGNLSDPECYPGGENERYLEIWNLVFSQFNHNPDGSYTPLPKKNIDTGMGLERMASVMQDVPSNFDTDGFLPIIQATCKEAGVSYGEDEGTDIALKVIADHVRTLVFAISDGVLPSNEGRGYVLRRLLRRAVRYGRKLGIQRPFMHLLTEVVVEISKEFYPQPLEKQAFISRVIGQEEERFLETLSDGIAILEQWITQAKAEKRSEISGHEAFKLYDTYGFPVDLTEDFAREQEMTVDRTGFEKEMEVQRERARDARQDSTSMQVQGGVLTETSVETTFVGYDNLESESEVVLLIVDEQEVDMVGSGTQCLLLLKETPFYAESGGQAADYGMISAAGVRARVEEVQKGPRGEHVHTVVIEEGVLRKGDRVTATVDTPTRLDTLKNHTATHLLHQALKDTLGEHVNQAGSLVASDRLRFDFSHFGSMTVAELQEVERQVNEQIWKNTPVNILEKSLSDAKAMGAMALFGEKYGDVVRVVQVGEYSIELCGGTHVASTAEIGLFKIMSEAGIGSGIRRIEAATGRQAVSFYETQTLRLEQIAGRLKTRTEDVVERVDGMLTQMKELQRENDSLSARLHQLESKELVNHIQEVDGIPVLAVKVNAEDMNGLRAMSDQLKQQMSEGVLVLGSASNGKVQLVATVSEKYRKQGIHAGKLIKEVATMCGGGGGGRPDMAQAGGKDPAKLDSALAKVTHLVRQQGS
ncbi:alanine--tRNA ligase [Mechercharimyces sp. CAU 1602]|uniref:alanine--tRNA ligase n=1 Tax=Mechercharimyces sp. CAU 1602 TaxID=2973933 RepID=UPI002162A249|nr:alanine--tRNA ligase [Mechercharimyces sp. CAU 1602]MCS1350261.1 alanine--tRNA ligase [Mechercharimyces sp. CAU 1602]